MHSRSFNEKSVKTVLESVKLARDHLLGLFRKLRALGCKFSESIWQPNTSAVQLATTMKCLCAARL